MAPAPIIPGVSGFVIAVACNSGSCVRILGFKDAFLVRAELLKPPGMITVSIKAFFQVENPHQYLLTIGRWGYMSATGILRALALSGRLLQDAACSPAFCA